MQINKNWQESDNICHLPQRRNCCRKLNISHNVNAQGMIVKILNNILKLKYLESYDSGTLIHSVTLHYIPLTLIIYLSTLIHFSTIHCIHSSEVLIFSETVYCRPPILLYSLQHSCCTPQVFSYILTFSIIYIILYHSPSYSPDFHHHTLS